MQPAATVPQRKWLFLLMFSEAGRASLSGGDDIELGARDELPAHLPGESPPQDDLAGPGSRQRQSGGRYLPLIVVLSLQSHSEIEAPTQAGVAGVPHIGV